MKVIRKLNAMVNKSKKNAAKEPTLQIDAPSALSMPSGDEYVYMANDYDVEKKSSNLKLPGIDTVDNKGLIDSIEVGVVEMQSL